MGYTVEDFIKSNEFSGIKIINNLYETNREIKGAQFISRADIEISGGGKLLLTSLRVYDNLDKNTVICHLEELNKKGVSGFIIKRRKDTVHQKELFELFIHFCDAHGIPVLELPHNISYWAVLKYVLCHAYDLDIAKYLYSEIVQDQINHFLLHERYDEQTIETFFKSLETMVGNSVSLYDENYHCIYPITGQKEFTIIGDEKYVPHITTKHEYIRQKREYVEYIQKIDILNYCHYYLVVTEVNEPLSELDFVTLDNIITALFYLLAQDVTKKEMEIKYLRDLNYWLINGGMSDAEEDDASSLLDLSDTDEYRVVIFYLKPENKKEKNSIAQKNETKNLKKEMYHYLPKERIFYNTNHILYIYNEKDWKIKKEFRNTLEEIHKDIQDSLTRRNKKFELLIGIGKSVKGYHGLKDSFKDSKAALEYIGLIREATGEKTKSIVDCAKLGFFQIFTNINDKKELRQYIPYSVIKLNKQDKKRNSELISTLECYLSNKQSIRKTSELMNVHPRTVSYRLSKIVDLTGIEFDNSAEILAVRNGIIILKILEQL